MTDSNRGAEQTWIHVARLIRPQGRRGEVLAEILSDFPNRFAELRNAFLWLGDKVPVTPILLEDSWLHKGKIVLKFADVDSISAAEALRGADLVISAAERMPLQPDEVYISDLIGCDFVDVAVGGATPAHVLGTIRDVIRQERTADLLIVASPDGVEYEIPFAKAYVVRIDLAAHRLEMHLPPGLLAVNAPLTEEERRARVASSESQS
ncbi:MAG TPA: ribosome maturation factor RimM [Acidobacteriaceae bacterium]|nr:ribosome maturation factor RimM [Acidobacteriaceae bacterium]